MNSSRVFSCLQIALAAAIWGAAYPLTKGALAQIPPLLLGLGRFAIASIILMVYTRSFPLGQIRKEDRFSLIALSFWGSFILVITMNFGLRWAPAGVASIISGTPPLFTLLFAWLWLKEKISPRKIIAVLLGFIGIAALTGDVDLSFNGWKTIAGCLIVTIPQVAWAIYSVLGKTLLARYPWQSICRDTFSLGAIMLLPFAVAEIMFSGVGTWDLKSLGVLLYLGILNSFVTYGLWNRALAEIPVSTASFLLYLQPVSGAILSYFLFGDRFGFLGWAGILLVFSGLSLALMADRDPEKRG